MKKLLLTFSACVPLLALSQGDVKVTFTNNKTISLPMEAVDSMQSDPKQQTFHMSYSSDDVKKISFSETVSESDVNLKASDKAQPFNQLFSMSTGYKYVVSFEDGANPIVPFPPKTESFVPSFSTSGSYIFINGKVWKEGDEVKIGKNIEVKVVAYNGDVRTYHFDAVIPSCPIIEIKTNGNLSGDWSDLKSISVDGKALDACKIKAKGGNYNSSEKNSFNIKFENKQEILNITKNKRWTLEANAGDFACIRALLGYNIASRVSGSWNPQAKEVVLMVDGAYMGFYLISEQPRVCKGRVESGMVMCIEDAPDEGDDFFKSRLFNSVFIMKDPETGVDGAKLVRTREVMEKLEQAIADKKWSQVHDMLDIESVAEWTVVNEIAKNDKSFASDTYIYIDDDKKIHFIPSTQSAKAFNADSDAEGFTAYDRNWLTLLKDDSDFNSALKKAFEKVSKAESDILSWIDKTSDQNVGDALANSYSSSFNSETYKNEIADLKDWLSARIKWLSSEWK
ncbi:MAG: CotH kinase family protein [Paludibacteraceae bacterium]|nr:CotH kinase family protein [Paludibacteraceae bacterium]